MMCLLRVLLLSAIAFPAAAEQFRSFDDVDVHYIVVNTLFLQPDVAARFGLVRGNDRAIVNLSVLQHDGAALLGTVTGVTINLLGQRVPLEFKVTREGEAVYYIAELRFTDQDVLRFDLTVDLPDRAPMRLEFQQQMYVEPSR
jgi:hypothetical protein